jgi:hypothetical protein
MVWSVPFPLLRPSNKWRPHSYRYHCASESQRPSNIWRAVPQDISPEKIATLCPSLSVKKASRIISRKTNRHLSGYWQLTKAPSTQCSSTASKCTDVSSHARPTKPPSHLLKSPTPLQSSQNRSRRKELTPIYTYRYREKTLTVLNICDSTWSWWRWISGNIDGSTQKRAGSHTSSSQSSTKPRGKNSPVEVHRYWRAMETLCVTSTRIGKSETDECRECGVRNDPIHRLQKYIPNHTLLQSSSHSRNI